MLGGPSRLASTNPNPRSIFHKILKTTSPYPKQRCWAHLRTGLLDALLYRDGHPLQQLLQLQLLLLPHEGNRSRKHQMAVDRTHPATWQYQLPVTTCCGLTSLTVMFLNSEDNEKTLKSSISLRVGFSSWL